MLITYSSTDQRRLKFKVRWDQSETPQNVAIFRDIWWALRLVLDCDAEGEVSVAVGDTRNTVTQNPRSLNESYCDDQCVKIINYDQAASSVNTEPPE